jgi:hypothetical protein
MFALAPLNPQIPFGEPPQRLFFDPVIAAMEIVDLEA